MRVIATTSSMDVYMDELEYTEAALAAHPDTAELVGPFVEEIEHWGAIATKQRATRRALNRADAVVGVRDETLDQLVSELGGVAFLEANRDRKSLAFRRFFPLAPSELIRQGLRRQCERTRDVLLPELAKVGPESPLARFAPALRAASEAALAALEERAKKKGEVAQVAHEAEEWKEGVNRLRRTTHAELAAIAARKGYAKRWPDSFFRASARSRAGATEAPEAALDAETSE